MTQADELERMVAAGVVSAGQADGARRVDDDIAATALGKLVCIGCDARALLPAYAQAFGIAAASDEALARGTRPPLPLPALEALASWAAAPTWAPDGAIEIVVTSADTAARLVELPLPAHRVVVGDEPRVAALLDRVLAAEPSAAPAPAAPAAPAARREQSGATPRPERFLARPVREIDRRRQSDAGAPIEPSPFGAAVAPVAAPFGAPFAAPAPFPTAAPLPTAPLPTAAPPSTAPGLDLDRPAPSAPAPAAAPAQHAQVRREVSRELPRPAPAKRGPPIAAVVVVVVLVGALAAGGFLVLRARAAAAPEGPADERPGVLAEGRAKEGAGDQAWALAAYTRVIDDPRRDDQTAEALLGRARCNVALGDREAALRDIEQVSGATFASPALKAKADALRASLH